MKKLFSFLSLSLLAALGTHAQLTFNTRDSINVNHINASVLLHGDMWWDPLQEVAKCEFPKGTGKHIGFVSAIWMSGYDAASNLHVAAQTYRQDGNDYWPGPLDALDTLTYATSTHWANFWKIRNTDLQVFQANVPHTVGNTPQVILTWPGTGNTYAAGNGGVPLVINPGTPMAPFVDVNGNGIYEPLLGDYPDVKGDQAIWWVFSDNGPTHSQSHGRPLGVEIHAMSYAYSRGTLLDNVVYYEYTLINKSANNYSNFRLAQATDGDLGFYNDDYIGFDSAHRMGILYNGAPVDGITIWDSADTYGPHSPVMGVTMVMMPGDTGTTHVPIGSYDYFNNDNSILGNPRVDTQYDNYMRSKTRNGRHFTNDFAGSVHPSTAYDTSSPPTNYVFTGDPSDTTQWSECAAGNIPGDRRFVISSNDFSLPAGASVKVIMALVVTDTTQGGCPSVGFHDIKVVADTAWNAYRNQPPPVPSAISNVNAGKDKLALYPNPVHNVLSVDVASGISSGSSLAIYNTVGQLMPIDINISAKSASANVAGLPAGLYYLLYKTDAAQQVVKFIKE